MEVSRNSDGVFDITCAPLVNLWGFGFNKKDSVTPAMIDSLKTFVGYRKVHLEGKKVVKDDPRLLLNCSAIAKGYSCDVIARLLEKEGVENYMILIGGEVVSIRMAYAGVPVSISRKTIRTASKIIMTKSSNYVKKARLPLQAIIATFISKTVKNMPIQSIHVPVIQPNKAC